MKTLTTSFLSVACLLFANTASGSFLTANGLLAYCEDNNQDDSSCMGYIAGVADTIDLSYVEIGKRICIPDGVAPGQLVDIVVKYLKEHPENRQNDAQPFVQQALSKAYPCEDKSSPKGMDKAK